MKKEFSINKTIEQIKTIYQELFDRAISQRTLLFLKNLCFIFLETSFDQTFLQRSFDQKNDPSKCDFKEEKNDHFEPIDETTLREILVTNLSQNGYIKTSNDPIRYKNYLKQIDLVNFIPSTWADNHEKFNSLKSAIYKNLRRAFKIQLISLIQNELQNNLEQKEFRKGFENFIKNKDIAEISNKVLIDALEQIEQRLFDWKHVNATFKNNQKEVVSPVSNLKVLSNNFFEDIYQRIKIANSEDPKFWKKTKKLTTWNGRFLIAFGLTFVLSTLFFEVFQGLSVWNESLSIKYLIYIGFGLLALLVLIGILLIFLYFKNKNYIKSYNISSNIEYKSIGKITKEHEQLIDFLDEVFQAQKLYQDEHSEAQKTNDFVWKISFDLTQIELSNELINQIEWFCSYLKIIRDNNDHPVFKNELILWEFHIAKSEKIKSFEDLEKIMDPKFINRNLISFEIQE
ncbi:hypothetical protein [Mycoplasmopsis gallopavonis]|uniref:Uncharacterized protein n=1 Tax=Mycoplasmopsis gallopavonis TaxID=76629 RepID=A0A449AYD0_9BACT|nr:hypothetical protein [Mycoplasmopsis gallopavonis]RIV16494.1 hypothetical protein D1113_02140 [Mycoplasmopsis gallopavonis]VEU72538.1 Uncharacterised protein [Mycoplasmopsis gallopavonis]VEU73327.1 Uncharacterised protein [Mycoplasmopsis gallopavonis]VEU73339.1 Uncharacterised protein [Mycoplasmopsis gallopavonis]